MESCSATSAAATSAADVKAAEEEAIILGALSSLTPYSFSTLSRTLAADLRLRHHRLLFLLLSPPHFSATLSHLRSLSLSHKALLLARLLLLSLHLLISAVHVSPPIIPSRCHRLHPDHLDAALLLLAMCDSYSNNNQQPLHDWRTCIARGLLRTVLSSSGLDGAVTSYISDAARCRRLLNAVTGGEKERKTAGAALTAVVALPSVQWSTVKNKSGEDCCAVCSESLTSNYTRDVCEMPCKHGFHWACILPWLRRQNTCPCCRYELPTDDVFCEIERLWRAAVQLAGGGGGEA